MDTQRARLHLASEILNDAIEAFVRETGLHLHVEGEGVGQGSGELNPTLILGDSNVRLAAQVKPWAAQANIGALIQQVHALPMPGILVADYINPQMAAKLRQHRIQFIDTAGNAYLDVPPLYILVTGKPKPRQTMAVKGGANRAFDRTGLKVVFAFLCSPALVAAPYRDIADVAGVALGTVGWVINGLKSGGFIFDYGRKQGRELVDYKRLLDRWVESYPEKLRPKVHIGDFLADDPYWWQDFDIKKFHGYWGEEIAAAHYTRYLKPAAATVYLPQVAKTDFLARARLRAAPHPIHDDAGVVKVYRIFWGDAALPLQAMSKPGLVPPVLAYADLIATADPRNLEAARMIYDEHIARHTQQA